MQPTTNPLLVGVHGIECDLIKDALEAYEAKFLRLIEVASDLFWSSQLDLTLTDVSPQVQALFGGQPEEWIGRSLTHLVHPEDLARVQAFFQQVIASGQQGVGLEFRHPHQEEHWVSATVSPIKDSQGSVVGFQGILRDISESKRLEAERKQLEAERAAATIRLQQSESLFRQLFEESADAILLLENGIFTDCNQATVRMMRCQNKAEFLALHPSRLSPEFQPDGRSSFEKANDMITTALRQGNHRFEWMHRRMDGEDFWVEVLLTRIQSGERQFLHTTWREIGDRKTAETELREQEKLLRSMYEGVEQGICILDVSVEGEFRFVSWNRGLEKLTGITNATIVGKTPEQLFGADQGAVLRQNYQRCLAAGHAITYEEYLPFQGRDIWWLTTLHPLKDEGDRIYRIVITTFEITDRKAAEQARSRLVAILEATSDIVGMSDMQGNSLYLNAAGRRLLEVSLEEDLTGIPIQDFHPQQMQQKLLEQAIPIAIEQGLWQGESALLTRSGKSIPVSQVIIAHQVKDGTPEYFSTIIRDITEQKQAEATLQRRSQRKNLLNGVTSQIRSSLDFETILITTVAEIRNFLQIDSCLFAWYRPNAPEPYWEVVQQSRSEGMSNLLGRYSNQTMGSVADQLLALKIVRIQDVNHIGDRRVKRLFTSVGCCATLSLPTQTSSGLIGVISCQHQTARCWEDDEVELLQALMEQLAIALNQANLYTQSQMKARELEETLQELQRTQLQMIQSEKMSSLGQLVAGVAHEINNPVNFIYGNVSPANEYAQDLLNLITLYQTYYPNPVAAVQQQIEAIDLEFVKEDLPRLLCSMRMGADRIRQIVSSLRTFSRLDEAAYKAVDIHGGIDSTLVILESRLKSRPERPAIQVIKQYGNLPLVECYAGQLNQVFMNILTNALDALEERDHKRSFQEIEQSPSSIWITTQILNQNDVEIRIADNGPGIPEAIRQRIFDPFFTTKPVGKGTGMGMSISYQIITENHRGRFKCLSSPGQGAEFVVAIPLKQPPDVRHD